MGVFLEYSCSLEIQDVMVAKFPGRQAHCQEAHSTNPALFFVIHAVIAGMVLMPDQVYSNGKPVYCSWSCVGLAEGPLGRSGASALPMGQ